MSRLTVDWRIEHGRANNPGYVGTSLVMYNNHKTMYIEAGMARMQRTQIYLDHDLSTALDRLARKRGTTRAGLIRLAARRYLEQEGSGEEDPIWGIVGLGSGGDGRVSEEHDRSLADLQLRSSS